jgi:hypothetical protein
MTTGEALEIESMSHGAAVIHQEDDPSWDPATEPMHFFGLRMTCKTGGGDEISKMYYLSGRPASFAPSQNVAESVVDELVGASWHEYLVEKGLSRGIEVLPFSACYSIEGRNAVFCE